jgi:pimeloyl-ACP methyl ester carboxylesterase
MPAVSELLAHEDRGRGDALVLIHGHPFDRRMWVPQLSSLAAGLRVIAPDLPGYGASAPRGEKIAMRGLADAVMELLDELGVERAVVAGLSMGGLVAMELGLGHPDRVAGLILAATTAAPVTPEEAQTRRATAAKLESDGMFDHAVIEMAPRLFGPRARRDPDIVEHVLHMMLRTHPAGAAAALRGRAERPDYSSLLRGLTMPALVIAGDKDGFASEEVVRQLVESLPDPEVLLLPGVGHLPNLEEPAAFDEAVRAFAARVA